MHKHKKRFYFEFFLYINSILLGFLSLVTGCSQLYNIDEAEIISLVKNRLTGFINGADDVLIYGNRQSPHTYKIAVFEYSNSNIYEVKNYNY